MRNLAVLLFLLLIASIAFGAPGDILRSQTLTGQPGSGVRGLAMDWDTGLIWVAGPVASGTINFTTMDPVTMATGTWLTASGMGWVFDIGYGYDDAGTKYILMNDQYSPYTKLIDPLDGSYDGNLPDYYASGDYTDGCAVDWNNNYVYLSSYANPDVVCYDGAAHSVFATIGGAVNMGTAVGWDHLFVIRTDPYYTIEVYFLDGTFIESIPLNSYPSNYYLMGLSCGQEDAVGNNESLFFADFVSLQVHEVEVGNYTTPGALAPSTWGEIKSGFGNPVYDNGTPSIGNLR